MSLDSALFLSINGTAASPHWLAALAFFATNYLPLLVAGAVAGAVITGDHPSRQRVLRMLLAMAIAWLLTGLVRHFFAVDRPFVAGLGTQWLPHAATPSFPSAHSSVAFALATVVMLTTRQVHWAMVAICAALWVAWSRVYLGVHYPSDVLAGALVGAASGWLVCRHAVSRPPQSAAAAAKAHT